MPGDVIYCREGARFGNAGRVIDKTEICLGQRTMLFRANQKVAVGEFIWAFLSSRGAYRLATRALDGSASPHVNVGEIVAFRVPVPPLSLQQKFASMCKQVDYLRAMQREGIASGRAPFRLSAPPRLQRLTAPQLSTTQVAPLAASSHPVGFGLCQLLSARIFRERPLHLQYRDR